MSRDSAEAVATDHPRNRTYQGTQVEGNAQAHLGDNYHHYGVTINANNVNVDDRLLQQLSVLGLNSAPPPKTFGLCLGEAPQIEQDAFIGRTTELRELQELLNFENQSQRIVSIVGMGGLGKTQLSLAYARQCSDQYTSIFWVNAKDELSLRQSLCSIADIVQSGTSVSVNDSKGEQTQVEVVRRWLSEGWNSRWLFIFDNYDDPNLPNIPSASGYNIRSYFPYRMQGHILITTRTPKLTFSSRLMLSKFDSVETSLMVLAQRAGRDLTTDTDARRLAERLDGLPLALATAGVYLGQTNVSCTEYLQAHESAWIDLYGPDTDKLLEYEDRTLSSTWLVSFDQVRRVDADAAELFKFWAYFDNKDIWYEMIKAGADQGPPWMCRVTSSKIKFNRAMVRLQDYSLVHTTSGFYEIHPCVHTWISEYFKIDRIAFLDALLCVKFSLPSTSFAEAWTTTRRLSAHLSRLNDQRFHVFLEELIFRSDVLSYIADAAAFFYAWDRLDQAEILLTRALTGYEQKWGSEDVSTLRIASNLGLLYTLQGRLDEANRMYLRAIAGFAKLDDGGGAIALTTLHNLGSYYVNKGDFDQAQAMYEMVLAKSEKRNGADHPLTLKTVSHLGYLYQMQGDLVAAESMLLRALIGREKVLGPDSPITRVSVNLLGSLYHDQGKLEQAEKLFLRAIGEDVTGKDKDPRTTLNTLANLGSLYCQQQEWTNARQVLSRIHRTCQAGNIKEIRKTTASMIAVVFQKSMWASRPDVDHIRPLFAQLLRLTEYLPITTGEITIMYSIARGLLWLHDEENALVAFIHSKRMLCDGCDSAIELSNGFHVCRSCEDTDLCGACQARYSEKTLTLPQCVGHDFFDVVGAISRYPSQAERLDAAGMSAWFERLKLKYPFAGD